MQPLVKRLLSSSILRIGSIRPILRGPGRGLRYRIFPDYGLSPLYGGWEPEAQRIMARYATGGSVFYDIGANYGIHTLLMARLVGPSGHVYAFEPVPALLSQIQQNVMLNRFNNVTCVDAAVSNITGTSDFVTEQHDAAIGHLAEDPVVSGDVLSVPTLTLDEFVSDGRNRRPDLIKIDVEGAESKVLDGAEEVLDTCRPILLVDLHTPEQDLAVGRILRRYGYTAYRTSDGTKVPDLSRGWPAPDGLWGQFVALAQGSSGTRLLD